METQKKVYLHIRHMDYWWSVYGLNQEENGGPNAVELSLTHDQEGEELLFHLDLYNLDGLAEIIQGEEFLSPDSPDFPSFCRRAQRLQNGQEDYFIGALYYPDFHPDLTFCNEALTPGCTITQRMAPAVSPYYGVLFLAEQRPLTPEILLYWVARLSEPLFGRPFAPLLTGMPTRREAADQLEEELCHAEYPSTVVPV